MREYLGSVAFNNITRLTFGKRFMNSKGEIDEQGQEFKGIVSNGIKIGGKLPLAEYVPWLRWFFTMENEALVKHSARRDRLTRMIMDEHTLARKKTGDTKQHFVDALLTLQKQYDLSDDTVIGLLWVSKNLSFDMYKSVSLSGKRTNSSSYRVKRLINWYKNYN